MMLNLTTNISELINENQSIIASSGKLCKLSFVFNFN